MTGMRDLAKLRMEKNWHLMGYEMGWDGMVW